MIVVSRSKIWFSISLSIMIIGLVFAMVRGINVGIDFTGGTMMQFDMGRTVEVPSVEKTLEQFKLAPEILHAGANKTEIVVRTKVDLNNDLRMKIFQAMKTDFKLGDAALISAEQFGPSIGKEIQTKAIYGILTACFFMMIYIWFRFEVVFGVAAMISLVHDVLILLAVYAIFYIPVGTSFIAAVLTVVGYSINDTIVIFDRIRENARFLRKNAYDELADRSINSTLSRSINTSLTTLIVIFVMYLLGVESIRNFAFPLLVGIATGTYSSIFIGSPIWAMWKMRKRAQAA